MKEDRFRIIGEGGEKRGGTNQGKPGKRPPPPPPIPITKKIIIEGSIKIEN